MFFCMSLLAMDEKRGQNDRLLDIISPDIREEVSLYLKNSSHNSLTQLTDIQKEHLLSVIN